LVVANTTTTGVGLEEEHTDKNCTHAIDPTFGGDVRFQQYTRSSVVVVVVAVAAAAVRYEHAENGSSISKT